MKKTPLSFGRRLLAALACSAMVLPGLLHAQPAPLPQAHAHNDYEHPRPLLDALAHGFCSVEADVHLVDGKLLVAHDREDVQSEQTLQALYLDPLRTLALKNAGRIHEGDDAPFILLIDIKSEAEATYAVLREVLQQYADILTIFTPTSKAEGAVTAIISGNRPRATMAAEPIRYAAYDGRLDDLSASNQEPPTFIPLVSSNWSRISTWYGSGEMPHSDRKELQRIVEMAHAQGRMVRFWATPDNPVVWEALYEAGVDLLNTDDLSGLQAFLLEQTSD